MTLRLVQSRTMSIASVRNLLRRARAAISREHGLLSMRSQVEANGLSFDHDQ